MNDIASFDPDAAGAGAAVADPTPEQLAGAAALREGVDPSTQVNDREALGSDAAKTRDFLNAQEQVSVRVPKISDQQPDEVVTINGYRAAVLKPGERQMVPKLVAEVLEQGGRI